MDYSLKADYDNIFLTHTPPFFFFSQVKNKNKPENFLNQISLVSM